MRFAGGLVLGLVVGAGLGAGGVWLALRPEAPVVAAEIASVDAAPKKAGKKKRRVRKKVAGGGGGGVASAGGGGGGVVEEEWVEEDVPSVSASDLAQGSEGDVLKPRARTVDLGAGGADTRNLTQAEIDGAVRARADAITRCIVDARGAAEVRGRVVIGVVVGPDGSPTAARVEAPRWLLEHGLGRCVRPTLLGLRFPAAGKDTVVTVPFDVE